MAQFKCPQCDALVTKDKDDELGCPCCGYAKDGMVGIERCLFPYVPYVPYVEPAEPNYVPQTPWQPYEITFGDNTCNTKVSFIGGQA